MKKRITHYLPKYGVFVWIAVALSLLCCAGWILNLCLNGCTGFWQFILWCFLPVFIALHLAQTMIFHSDDRFYRVSVSFTLLMLTFAGRFLFMRPAWYFAVLAFAVALLFAVIFRLAVTGNIKSDWLMILTAGLPMAGILWMFAGTLFDGFRLAAWLAFIPDVLMLLVYIYLCFCMKTYPQDDGVYHPTWGDRYDGRRVRSLDPISNVGVYIMPDRNGADNRFFGKIEVSAIEKYVREKRLAGFEHFGTNEVLLAAYVRTLAKYPAMNRFISGQKIYTRDGDIQFCMTVKKEMRLDAPETIIKLHLNPADTAEEVYRKFRDEVANAQKSEELDASFDALAAVLGAIPGLFLKFSVWLLKTLDYFNKIPRFLLELSPFHASVFFTSMGSLGIPAISHHLYDFGNVPVFFAFGCKRRESAPGEDGATVVKKYIDFAFTLDERTADGYYYAAALKYFQRILRNPAQLDNPPEEIVHDIP